MGVAMVGRVVQVRIARFEVRLQLEERLSEQVTVHDVEGLSLGHGQQSPIGRQQATGEILGGV